jgi:hypothetical protein
VKTFWRLWCRVFHRAWLKSGQWTEDGYGGFGRIVCCPACSRIWTEWK